MLFSIGLMTAAAPAPNKHLARLLLAETVAAIPGNKSTTRFWVILEQLVNEYPMMNCNINGTASGARYCKAHPYGIITRIPGARTGMAS